MSVYNLDGEKPAHIPQEQWDKLKSSFNDIYEDDSEEDEEISIKFVCEILAELFDFPCNFSPPEEELHATEECMNWCEDNCNKATAAECWERYFQLKFDERNGGKSGI